MRVDELRVYNRPLCSGEVTALMNLGNLNIQIKLFHFQQILLKLRTINTNSYQSIFTLIHELPHLRIAKLSHPFPPYTHLSIEKV